MSYQNLIHQCVQTLKYIESSIFYAKYRMKTEVKT